MKHRFPFFDERKHGFVEIPVDKEKLPFNRAYIAYEQYFSYEEEEGL